MIILAGLALMLIAMYYEHKGFCRNCLVLHPDGEDWNNLPKAALPPAPLRKHFVSNTPPYSIWFVITNVVRCWVIIYYPKRNYIVGSG